MRTEIYVFSNAGGTIEVFSKIYTILQNDFECFRYEYPGHGSDNSELCDSIDELIDKALNFYYEKHVYNNNIILFGYSMGTIVAMEILKRIEGKMNGTIGIILAADSPQNFIVEDLEITEDNIKHYYMKNGGISNKLINSMLFKKLY